MKIKWFSPEGINFCVTGVGILSIQVKCKLQEWLESTITINECGTTGLLFH